MVHHLPERRHFRGGSGYHGRPVLWRVLGGSAFAAESPEVPAGRSAFPCSAARAAVSGAGPCLEAVRFCSGSAGACGCRGWTFRLGSVRVSWGARSSSLLWDWHRVLCLVIARDGGRGRMRPVTRCSGGDGLTCRKPSPHIVADVSPRWGGRARRRGSRVKVIGSKTATRRGGRPTAQAKPSRRKRGHHDHEACGTT